MAGNTFKWSRFNQERFRSMKFRPALRTISAISSGWPVHLFVVLQRERRLTSACPEDWLWHSMGMRKMQVERSLFQIAMTEQQLDGAKIGAGFEQMGGKAVPQSVRMNVISEACSCRGCSASLPDHFGSDRSFAGVPAIAGKQPQFRWMAKSAQVTLQFLQQFRAEHDIAVLTALPAFDVNDHSFTIYVLDFQMRQFGAPQPGCVERHQKNPVEHGWSGIDKFRYLLHAEDLGKPKSLRG